MYPDSPSLALINLIRHLSGPVNQNLDHLPGIIKATRALHIADRIMLDLLILRLLLQNIQQRLVGRVAPNTMNNRKRELSLGQVLAHALVSRVLLAEQILVVVGDLKDEPNDVDKWYAVDQAPRFGLHQLDAQPEQATRLVADHFEIVVLGRARESVAPKEIHTLPAVKIDELFGKYVDSFWVL